MNQLHASQIVSTLRLSLFHNLRSLLAVILLCWLAPPVLLISQKALSRAMLLTTYLPSPLLRHRLKTHTTVIHQLDKALAKLGINQLTDQEVKSVRASLQYQPSILGGLLSFQDWELTESSLCLACYSKIQALYSLTSFLGLFFPPQWT